MAVGTVCAGHVYDERYVFTGIEGGFGGVQQKVEAFAANGAAHEEKGATPATWGARSGAFWPEKDRIESIGKHFDVRARDSRSPHYITNEGRRHPELVDIPLDFRDPGARNGSIFPRQDDGELAFWRATEIGRPLMADGQSDVANGRIAGRREAVAFDKSSGRQFG